MDSINLMGYLTISSSQPVLDATKHITEDNF